MKIEQALNKLFSLHQFGIKLGLESIKNLLDFLDNPQKKLKCFHIAGSNGKGSTSSFISSILTENGFKTGLYTSPHLVRFNERIRINGVEIPDEFILAFMKIVDEYISKNSVTFFELTTAMAFLYFAKNEVDFAVIETGLGGRLDATNVINPLASVITTISLEHTNILGNTLSEIASEKAAIIKKNSKVFIGLIDEKIKNVFIQKSLEESAAYYFLSECTNFFNTHLSLRSKLGEFKIYETPLLGSHQLNNAALAILTLSETLNNLDGITISRGIRNVVRNTGIQARYEIYNFNPRVIFDAAHNLEGVTSFINQFQKEINLFETKILIFGTMRDKDYRESLILLKNFFDKIYFVSIDYERAVDAQELVQIASELGISGEPLDYPAEFIKRFILNKNSKQCLVALGSIYILGEVKSKLLSNNQTLINK